MEDWLTAPWGTVLETAATVFIIYSIIVLFVRLAGLRTFAKMSSFDFASTVAMGSILATVVMNSDTSILKGAVALAAIMLFQQIFAGLKLRVPAIEDLTQNSPTLLMDGTEFLHDNMRRTGVNRSDIVAKLREANVIELSEVKAVVLETTGDISVLHGTSDKVLDGIIMEGVVR
ncbi:DUF421 domain-containing protein [Neolewinella sp.]|uniref:DUF421 domain-containing protein n=1 Tax=Neolewinella sp. TaxID=2993543 RepID=UPI003B51F862